MSALTDKIIEAKEIYGDERAANMIAEGLQLESFNEDKLTACCPFHGDTNPSFMWNKKDHAFKCFVCQKRFGILDLFVKTEGNYKKALKRLFTETEISHNLSALNTDKEESDIFKDYKYPHEEVNTDRTTVNEYCSKRGISESTLDYAGVKQDARGNVVFELRDFDDTLLAVKYRPSRSIKPKEPKMWWQKDRSMCNILYNINKIDITQPIVITEGYFDTLAIIESGYTNVVSIPGGAEDEKWIEFNYDFLETCEQIIFWYDNDKAGQTGLNKAISRIGEYKCKIVKPTKEHEEEVRKYYKKFNENVNVNKTDANNILLAMGKEAIRDLIRNAEDIPADDLIFLMDAQPTNLKDAEKFSTGIQAFDNLGYGTIVPSFEIYSGYTGSGKTSLANLTGIVAAVEQGYKAFVFSGELGPGMLSDWIISPLAGFNHITEYHDPKYKKPFYTVTPEALEKIRDFYRKKIVAYNDRKALSADGAHLISRMEYAYKKHNCRSFLIDNLMCLSFEDLNDDNQWKTQKKFIIDLMGFSEKFNVSVKLIVHPKKPSPYQKQTSAYDLLGPIEIANLCHRMYWVTKHNPESETFDGYNTTVESIKDRLAGSQGKCKLYYCEKTKRIYSTLDELRKQYAWEKGVNINYNADTKSKLILNSFPRALPNQDANIMPY